MYTYLSCLPLYHSTVTLEQLIQHPKIVCVCVVFGYQCVSMFVYLFSLSVSLPLSSYQASRVFLFLPHCVAFSKLLSISFSLSISHTRTGAPAVYL